jgi:hypothetical protein
MKNTSNNKNKLCLIVALACLFEIVFALFESILADVGNYGTKTIIVRIFGTLITMIPVIYVCVFAFLKKPERFREYAILGAITSAFGVVFILIILAFKNSEFVSQLKGGVSRYLEHTWLYLIEYALCAAFFFLMVKAMEKQRKSNNGYTKNYVYTEFILIGIYAVLTLTSSVLSFRSVSNFVLDVLVTAVDKAVLVCFVLVTKYITPDKQVILPVGQPPVNEEQPNE